MEEVFEDPKRVFNFDETAIYLHPKKKNVIARKGTKNVYSVGSGNEKECMTVLLGCNANGDCPPTMVVYSYKRIPPSVNNAFIDGDGSICMSLSKSGWMNGEVFYDYIKNRFYPWAIQQKLKFPIVVLLDGHASHLTLPLSEFCNRNEIILIALPPNATHIMQPIDVGIIFPLKCIWKRKRDEWKILNGHDFSRAHFAPLLSEALAELQAKKIIFSNAFRACGNYIFTSLNLSCKLSHYFILFSQE